ncbi:MAG: DNA primase [Planctomycetota bacterium]
MGDPSERNMTGGGDSDRVKQASDIVRVVGEHLELKARGREYVGLCPFHDDRTPSMAVVPAKQIFHCFACGAGGDVFSFVMRYHRMEFVEALRYLADRAGIELAPRRSKDGRAAGGVSKRGTLAEANAFAQAFFQTILNHAEHGRTARELVERRGIAAAMVEAFGIGASPDRWDGLLKTIEAKSLAPEPFAEVGLLKTRDSGGRYDALRNRLIFPIMDQTGRVIAFGGRRVNDEDDPKYLNSPESELFNKSATLYGIHRASRPIQTSGVAIVTEGYTDVVACHQAGVENAVATLGTALTREHARLLRRLCHTVVLLFDGDDAGLRAADRAVEVFFAEAVDVKIATLAGVTDAKDPDELLKRDGGRELFDRAIDEATDILEFRLEATRRRLSVDGVSAFEQAYEDEVRKLAQLGLSRAKPVRKQRILQRLVELTGLPDRAIAEALAAVRVYDPVEPPPPAASGRSASGLTEAGPSEAGHETEMGPAEWVVGAMLRDASLLAGTDDRLRHAARGSTSRLLETLEAGVSRESADPLGDLMDELGGDEALRSYAVGLERRVDRETDGDPERVRALFHDIVTSLGDPAADARQGEPTEDIPPSPEAVRDRLAKLRSSASVRTGQGRRLPKPGS